ncbi:hypothetical protein [Desulfosporosinus sp. FKB]|nr:hypothetical protein [Desulfosporosinus sp. FKB]
MPLRLKRKNYNMEDGQTFEGYAISFGVGLDEDLYYNSIGLD